MENNPKIPAFPKFSPVALAHGDEIRGVLAGMERPISEWSFANLYLFRDVHGYRVSRLGGLLLILARGYDGKPYAFPPWGNGDVEAAARELCGHLSGLGEEPLIFPVPKDMVRRYFDSGRWEAVGDRDSADYVYLTENLALLPGKKYHKRKNRLSKYLREAGAGYAYAELGAEHVRECRELALMWCGERCSLERPSTYLETEAAVEALDRRLELGLTGGVALNAGAVAAYCLGEPLSPDVFAVHFEKALPGVDGPAQAINRDFCLYTIRGYRYVNREQDLGDPGLRHAKESYYPEFLAEKHRLRPRTETP